MPEFLDTVVPGWAMLMPSICSKQRSIFKVNTRYKEFAASRELQYPASNL
jgi:hypothetical protein